MSTGLKFKQALRDWIVKTNKNISTEDLEDDTPIIEQRIITSLQTIDLILFLEQLTGNAIDVAKLKVGVFRTIDIICETFGGSDSHAR